VAGQPGQYSRDMTAGTCEAGQVGLKSQAKHVRLDRQRGQTERTGRPEYASEDRASRTGPSRQDSRDRTDRKDKGQSGHDSMDSRAEGKRTETGSCDRTDLLERTVGTGQP
jgi:hypothetical protein